MPGNRCVRVLPTMAAVLLFFSFLLVSSLGAQQIVLEGSVTDPRGDALPYSSVQLLIHDSVLGRAVSGPDGLFEIKVGSAGEYVLKATAVGFRSVSTPLSVGQSGNVKLRFG